MNMGRLGRPAMLTNFPAPSLTLGLAVLWLLKASSVYTFPTAAEYWPLSEVGLTNPSSGCIHSQCTVKETCRSAQLIKGLLPEKCFDFPGDSICFQSQTAVCGSISWLFLCVSGNRRGYEAKVVGG